VSDEGNDELVSCDICCAMVLRACTQHHATWHMTLTNLTTKEHADG
jgi:hypothetical protein